METGSETSAPMVNMNVVINNYININTNGFDSKFPSSKSYYPEYAKPKSAELKLKKIDSFPSFDTQTKTSSQIPSPKAGAALELPQSVEELEIKSIVSLDKKSDIYEPRQKPSEDESMTQLIGYSLITIAAAMFIGVFYSVLVAPFVGETSHPVLDFIYNDSYYCCLIPLLIPCTFMFFYTNWVSVKFFRHA